MNDIRPGTDGHRPRRPCPWQWERCAIWDWAGAHTTRIFMAGRIAATLWFASALQVGLLVALNAGSPGLRLEVLAFSCGCLLATGLAFATVHLADGRRRRR